LVTPGLHRNSTDCSILLGKKMKKARILAWPLLRVMGQPREAFPRAYAIAPKQGVDLSLRTPATFISSVSLSAIGDIPLHAAAECVPASLPDGQIG
jgi:hypothetical protein